MHLNEMQCVVEACAQSAGMQKGSPVLVWQAFRGQQVLAQSCAVRSVGSAPAGVGEFVDEERPLRELEGVDPVGCGAQARGRQSGA